MASLAISTDVCEYCLLRFFFYAGNVRLWDLFQTGWKDVGEPLPEILSIFIMGLSGFLKAKWL